MKKFLSLVLALVMTMSLVTISAGAKDFTDDSTINYAEAVDVMSAVKVIGGYADGSFKPQGGLTRGAAAKIICNMILGPTTAGALKADSAPYKDVAVDNTFAGYIAFCAKEGIISGYADGTFRPAAPLSGYAFMKMLLGALGYDAAIEGYTGANWSINVAKRALNIELDKGLKGEFVGSKSLTREEACLYAFNAMNTKMVEYSSKGTQITINGVVIASGASEAKETKDTFADVYFTKLDGKDDTDAFGRPATTWKNGKDKIGTYADEADATYTEKVASKTIYADLGLDETVTADVFVDGEKDGTFVIAKKDDKTKTGGNGVLTEVFKEDEDVTIIQINTYIGEVEDIDENDDDERIIVVDGKNYVTEEFEEDDVVLYTEADGKIQSVALAEKLEGKLTKISGGKYTIDGEVYELNDGLEKPDVKVKKDVEYYLDAYGYIIKIDLTKDADITVDDLAYVLGYNKADDIDNARAKLLFADGSKKTVDVSKVKGDMAKDDIVSFKVNDDGEYELTVQDQTSGSVKKSDPKFATGVVANSKTVYVYSVTDKDGDTTIETYTGYKNAPTVNKGTAVAYVEEGKAVLVYVKATDVDDASTTSELTFIAVKADADKTDDGDNEYYTFSAVVDGEVTELDIDVDAISGEGVQIFKSYKTNKDGIVTTLTKSDKVFEDAETVKTGDDVITLDGEAYAYTDDVLVLVVDDNEFSIGSIGGIKDKAGYYETIQFSTTDKGLVDVVVLTKA